MAFKVKLDGNWYYIPTCQIEDEIKHQANKHGFEVEEIGD